MNKLHQPSVDQRIVLLDVLRGFAVMAIFIVNIKAMIAPFSFYSNPTLWTGEHDQTIAVMQSFLVDNKWRTLFTALFGAGLVLISAKSDAADANATARLYRRNFFLLMFGLIHLLLIWSGDILTIYSLAGFIAILFRNKSAKALTIWAICLFVISYLRATLFSIGPLFDETLSQELSAEFWGTDPALTKEVIATFLGPITGHIDARLIGAKGFILFYGLMGGFIAMTLAIMIAGMALFKSGFLQGRLALSRYLPIAIIGLGTAWGLEYFRYQYLVGSGWAFEASMLMNGISFLSGPIASFGYAALLGVLMHMGIKFSAVGAVGRMAFTNYIASSLIGTTIAYGHGFGQFGSLTLAQGMMICGASFVAMLIWSPIWLSMFRFGPLEWLWRSLTYGKLQKFRK